MNGRDMELRWQHLTRFTPARIALGRAGAGLPTRHHLDFELALAEARDAVHEQLDVDRLRAGLSGLGLHSLHVRSEAADRHGYLLRPDLGRRLHPASRNQLATRTEEQRLLIVIADGLSAKAAQTHAIPLLSALAEESTAFMKGSMVIAEQARVALGDQIAEVLGAAAVAILIGERPGLSAPDSLGIYFTYRPRADTTDAERNCISNIRRGGLSYQEAAKELTVLLETAELSGFSGVRLKQFGAETARRLPVNDDEY